MGIPADIIIRANEIENPGFLEVGRELVIPGLYKAEEGDTFFSIAAAYGIGVDELLKLNNLAEGDLLIEGQQLLVPQRQEPGTSEKQEERGQETQWDRSADESKEIQTASLDRIWPHEGARTLLESKLGRIMIEGAAGDPVAAVEEGEVCWADEFRGYNKMVIIKSVKGALYIYSGNKDLAVAVGDRVSKGDIIASMGQDPQTRRSRIFFMVYRNGEPAVPEL